MNLREVLNRSQGDSYVIAIKSVYPGGGVVDSVTFDYNKLTGEYRQYKRYPFKIGDEDINKYLDKYYDEYYHVHDEGGRLMLLVYEHIDLEDMIV